MPAASQPESEHAEWLRANQQDLLAHLSAVKHRLARYAGRIETEPVAFPGVSTADADAPTQTIRPLALAHLVAAFGLTAFERDILLLCAGMELDDEFPALCAASQKVAEAEAIQAHPTFSLALAAFAEPHWSAVTTAGPLRYWRLVEVGTGPGLTRAPLRIDERVLHFLAGERQLDARLEVLLEPLPPSAGEMLVASHASIAEKVADVWSGATQGRDLQVVQLCGTASDCRPLAAAAAAMLGLRAARLAAERLPSGASDLDSLLRLWEREAELSGLGILMVDCDDDVPPDSDAGRIAAAAVARVMERATGPVILRAREPRRLHNRPSVILDVAHPLSSEQLAVWRSILGDQQLDEASLAAAAGQFSLSVPAMRAIAIQARAQGRGSPPAELSTVVWDLCRRRLRTALEGLAHRIESDQRWDDLVLPPSQKEVLRAIAVQLRQRNTVHELWGFGHKTRRGLGISALFHGPSGTGKTMAAEVLANELRLDLYHIDLSRVVSKYIGETEDNLRRVFDAAEENGAILLFDEADSLFGSRSEVKDSHDRYANIEVSYLLQRMESYRGLAILTTNMRSALDSAFLRRIRFAVDFPFPDEPQRAAIWRGVFPPDAPTLDLDAERLARLRLAGGSIRNIALNAAFLAADFGEPVQMRHIRAAARTEYAKLDRRLTRAEAEAWV
jgi:hypothetical protein